LAGKIPEAPDGLFSGWDITSAKKAFWTILWDWGRFRPIFAPKSWWQQQHAQAEGEHPFGKHTVICPKESEPL
jgi:hypothetical protein